MKKLTRNEMKEVSGGQNKASVAVCGTYSCGSCPAACGCGTYKDSPCVSTGIQGEL